jgi:hypothetical protein
MSGGVQDFEVQALERAVAELHCSGYGAASPGRSDSRREELHAEQGLRARASAVSQVVEETIAESDAELRARANGDLGSPGYEEMASGASGGLDDDFALACLLQAQEEAGLRLFDGALAGAVLDDFGGDWLLPADYVMDDDVAQTAEDLRLLAETVGDVTGLGLSPEEIAARPIRTIRADEEVTCCVCLADVEAGEDARALKCGHLFHPDCIDPWLVDKKTCPMCQGDA